MSRDLRDILAEALWREPGFALRKPWAVWDKIAPDETERVRMRADHIIRLLTEMGLTLARTGEEAPSIPAPTSSVIWKYRLAGAPTERMVRKGPEDQWQIVMIESEGERVEVSFSLSDVHIEAGMVLMGDPAAARIPNLGKKLAALSEIYRVDAVGMEAPQERKEAAHG